MTDDRIGRLDLEGEYDSSNAEKLAARFSRLVDGGYDRILVDLENVTFLGSAPLGCLIRTRSELRQRGGTLVLLRPSQTIAKTLRTLGLEEHFNAFDDEDDAIAFLKE